MREMFCTLRQSKKHMSGRSHIFKEKSIEKGKDTDGDEARFVLTDMQEKLTSIHLVHKGFPTDKFEYTVEVEGEFSKEAMEELDKKNRVAVGSH